MSALKPLVRRLQRSLRALLLRRVLAWLVCAAMLVVLGGALASPFGKVRVLRLGLLMAAFSALPAVLFWPPSERFLSERLRRLDEGMVFEAYLEAEPGQARDLLRPLAVEQAAALAFLQPPREPLLAGLGWLFATATSAIVLVELGSYLVLGHPFPLSSERPPSGARIEEQGFSEFATEAPVARQSRRERLLHPELRGKVQGEHPALGRAIDAAERVATSRRAPNTDAESSGTGNSALQEFLAKQQQGDLERGGVIGESGPSAAPGGTTGGESRQRSDPEGNPRPSGTPPGDTVGPALPGVPPTPGRGQGYEHTADTQVPSPLLDYRSRFEARFAERTGRHVAASGRLGLAELRHFQHRYFASFSLHAEVGAADDPYITLLKRRWMDVKGGVR